MPKQNKADLVPPDLEHCQVIWYHPFTLGGQLYRECGQPPSWVVTETKPGRDGLMGSMSVCEECRQKYATKEGNPTIDPSWHWESITPKQEKPQHS